MDMVYKKNHGKRMPGGERVESNDLCLEIGRFKKKK